MTRLVIDRFETSDQGTFGKLQLPTGQWLFTGELPERDNHEGISCIPKGTYPCDWTWSNAFKRMMYLVQFVPGRTGVRIHSANFMGDSALGHRCQLKGCISPGKLWGVMDNQKAVMMSAVAVSILEGAMERRPFDLEIR